QRRSVAGLLLGHRTPDRQAILLLSRELAGMSGHGVLLLAGHPCTGRTPPVPGRPRSGAALPGGGQRQAPILRSMGPNVSAAVAGMAAPLGARDNSSRAERRHTSLRPVTSAQCISTASAACQVSLEPCSTA